MLVEKLENIKKEIQLACSSSRRQIEEVTMVAVTKAVDSDQTIQLAKLGITNMAENRSEKFLLKKEALAEFTAIKWHFIGNLQRRKVKSVINELDFFHALDSLSLAEEIQKRAKKTIKCFIEVNITGEKSKHGIKSEEVVAFVQQLELFNKVEVVGLMTMAPYEATEDCLHETFSKLKKLQLMIKKQHLSYAPCTELSMGMSNDYKIAIEEGATVVRIGTAIFEGA